MAQEKLEGLRQVGEEFVIGKSVVKRSLEGEVDRRHVALFIPGAINPAPDWIAEIIQEDMMGVSPIIPVSVAWDEAPSPLAVILGIGESAYIDELSGKIEFISKKYRSNKIHIVAHSWGTYAIFKTMKKNKNISFENIFLLGSVVKSSFVRKFSDRYAMVHCDMAEDDEVSRKLSNWLFFRYGNSSMNGIHDGEKSKNVRFNGGHVELASRDHYLFKIRPRIMGQEFDSGKVSLTSNSHHIRHWIVRYSVIFIYFLVFLSLAYIFRGIFL